MYTQKVTETMTNTKNHDIHPVGHCPCKAFLRISKGRKHNNERKILKNDVEDFLFGSSDNNLKRDDYDIYWKECEDFIRKCFLCNRLIPFQVFCSKNPSFSDIKIIELWTNPYLEFSCCSCIKEIKII